MKTHTKPYNCQTCTRGFSSRLDLQRHVKSQHRVGNEKYRCLVERCVFKSDRKDNLRRHQKKKHNALLFGCPDGNNNKTDLPGQKPDVHGTTQLYSVSNFMLVAASGDLDRLETFLDAGLEIEARAEDQSTVLHCAAKAGQAATVKHLLTKGASVIVWNDKHRLPIHEAILSSSPETLECFLERLTQEDLHASKNRNFESYLARSGNADIVDVYLTRLGSDYTDMDVTRKFIFAIRTGHHSLVTALLDDPDFDGNRRIPSHSREFAPIHVAAMLGRTTIMESLITCDRIDLNLKDSLSRQPLHIAASRGHTAIVEQLIGRPDSDANCQDERGATPLHLAASNGHNMVVTQLIRHPGINVRCQDKDAATPLHYAASHGHWEMISLLLGYWDLMDSNHCLPSDIPPISISLNKEDSLHRLLERPDFGGPNRLLPGTNETLLNLATRRNDCELIAFLLAYPDIDVNVSGGSGLTPLMAAAQSGKVEAVNLLLQHKDIDVNQRSSWGGTALKYAKLYKHNEIVDLLLSHGAIDYYAKAPSTVPTTIHIDNSQNTTLRPDHGTIFDSFNDKAWDDFFDMEEGMDE